MDLRLRLLVAAIAVAGFVVESPRAAAEFLSLEYISNRGGTASVTLNGTPSTNANAGAFIWEDVNDPANPSFSPPPIVTFCIEVEQDLPTGDPRTATFAVLDPTLAPTIGNNPAKVEAIKALYGNFYDFANKRVKDVPNAATDRDANRAFQLALWEIVYDFGNPAGLDVSNGSFVSRAVGTNPAAQALLDNLSGGLAKFNASGFELVALVAPAGGDAKSQDQVQDHITVRPVPAPPAVLLAGIGVLALVGRARFGRRTA